MKVIYIAGPYRSYLEDGSISINGVFENISHARRVALHFWKEGWAVICPHMNTAFMDGSCSDRVWLKGDLEILSRCDAICMISGWEFSEGAKAESRAAGLLGFPFYFESVNGEIWTVDKEPDND
jgi:dienelactone hydrolase